MTQSARRTSLIIIRMLLGIVFLLSGTGKLIDSGYVNYDLVRLLSTKFFWLIEYAAPIVITISSIELLIALWLFWGKKIRWSLGIACAMILFFSAILGYFYLQGMSVASCGCFGAFGIGGGLTFSLLKNLILVVLIVTAFMLSRPKKESLEEPIDPRLSGDL